ncbi:MAG: DNA polymerase III subunit gamma/tau [Candidatus Sumerlaeia bacterium]|nr:DNA polymerase III subunit gamma/tau [Candidatus Sumerlaeia bacterium]
MPTAPAGSYQVIARRYRPGTFAEVIGQQAVVQMLHNEIREGRVGHGYLFCGPRGTGKTSMARIFAKALNCVNGPTTTPCGKCSHCLEIAGGTHLDVIEVDAATYTKAETTRELMEGVGRSPFSARKKVYIIDEVHMLSTASFNALLKTLEEPPAHVVFILATTNPEKIPETVISRCRRCNFDRIGLKEMTASLGAIVDKESVRVAEQERAAVLNAIALASDGGLRDAQVLLDQLISLAEDELTLETVRSLLGVVEGDLFTRLLGSLVARNTADCLMIVGELVERGRDLQRFTKMFLSFLRDAVILKAGGAPDLARVVDPTATDFCELLDRTTLPFLLNATQQFLDLEERLRGSAPPRFLLEFALIKLTAIDPRLVLDPEFGGFPGGGGAQPASSASTRAAGSGASTRARSAPAAPMAADSMGRTRAALPSAAAIQEIHTTDVERWVAFVERVSAVNATCRSVLTRARLVQATESKIHIELAAADLAMRTLMDRAEIVQHLREAAEAVWRRPLFPTFTVAKPEAQPSPASTAPEPIEYVEPPAPRRVVAEPEPAPEDDPGPLSFKDALEAYPEFRQACEMVEQAFGVKPVRFNGRDVG